MTSRQYAHGSVSAITKGRMNWWYDSIIDWMIRNPGQPLYKCADEIGRSRSAVYAVVSSDVFQMALAERKAAFAKDHDFAIVTKSARIANLALDLQLETLEKKRAAVGIKTLKEIGDSALARLGYGPKTPTGPGVTVNNNYGPGAGGNVTVLPVNKADLEAARQQLRQNEQRRLIDVSPRVDSRGGEREAGPEVVEALVSAEVADAPTD